MNEEGSESSPPPPYVAKNGGLDLDFVAVNEVESISRKVGCERLLLEEVRWQFQSLHSRQKHRRVHPAGERGRARLVLADSRSSRGRSGRFSPRHQGVEADARWQVHRPMTHYVRGV